MNTRVPRWSRQLHLANRYVRGERRDQGRPGSSVHLAAIVAHHDAPRIGERAATCGRSVTEGGDEPPGEKPSSVRAPPRERPRRTTRPKTCTLAVHSAALVAGHDAPFIGERAARADASQRKVAMSTPVRKGRCPFALQHREPERTAGTVTRVAATRPTEPWNKSARAA
jgi:hypothetical protein